MIGLKEGHTTWEEGNTTHQQGIRSEIGSKIFSCVLRLQRVYFGFQYPNVEEIV